MKVENARRIDVHHHIVPPVYKQGLDAAGIGDSAGRGIPTWQPADSLAHMDALGVETGICSISEPALYHLVERDAGKAKALARETNEYMAELVEQYPGRFGAFALLPMPDVEASLEELAYALDVLKLDGIGLLSNYRGEFLGDRRFAPLFDAAQERGACVYIHPSVPPPPQVMPRPEYVPLDYFEEFCFNTTRAAVNLILSGTMERCPDIKPVLSHMGGTLPYLAWRIDACLPDPGKKGTISYPVQGFVADGWGSLNKSVFDYVARFYFDTALAAHPIAFDAVERLAPGHTVFGSDSFYATPALGQRFVAAIESHFTGDALDAVNRGNAAGLFPRFAG